MQDAILITGCGKRIGYHLSKHLIDNGFHVIGTFRTHYETIDELNALGATCIQSDFYQTHSCKLLAQSISSQFNSLRAIIHNASDWLPEKDTSNLEETFQKMMTIHCQVPYLINYQLSDLLAQHHSDYADIIHITDFVAQKGSKKHIAYAASKAALENLTLSFAAKLAPKIKVNSIAPALIKFNEGDDKAYQEKALAKALIPKEGGYASVNQTVDYILNNHYVTGRSFSLDGGRHLK